MNATPSPASSVSLPPDVRAAIRAGDTAAACLSCDAITADAVADEWFRIAQYDVEGPNTQPARTLANFCSVACMKAAVARL